MDKELIASRFSKAYKSYDNAAIAQRIIHKKMLDIIVTQYNRTHFENVLEIGCGNGCFTRLIENNLDIKNWTINDLVDYIDYENTFGYDKAKYVNRTFGDAETMEFDGKYDLIISSCAIQWFNNPIEFILRLTANMTTDGILLMSTFGNRNLYQIKDIIGIGLQYNSIEEYRESLRDFEPKIEEDEINLYFDTPYDVLKHIKNTGVTAITTDSFYWNKQRLKDFEIQYKDIYTTEYNKVKLTYHPIYIHIKNDSSFPCKLKDCKK